MFRLSGLSSADGDRQVARVAFAVYVDSMLGTNTPYAKLLKEQNTGQLQVIFRNG